MWSNCKSNVSNVSMLAGFTTNHNQHLTVVLMAAMSLVVFCIGCSAEVRKIWGHLRHPTGILVGLLCQFGIMPLTAYLLALGFSITSVQAIAVIILGSCPGGIFSNIITYWIDGDVELSITMTSISTLLATAGLPLSLYIYTQGWIAAGCIQIPYLQIGFTFITMIIPVSFGIVTKYKWPKAAKIILKIGSAIGGLVIMGLGVISVLLEKVRWNTSWPLLVIGGVFPILGGLAGFGIAVVLQQPLNRSETCCVGLNIYYVCRTIAMETGAQNMHICLGVLQLVFSLEQLAEVIMVTVMYSSVQLCGGLLLVL
ncbi:hypothetical protein P4O66_016921, partial [Electrophorus voltai]